MEVDFTRALARAREQFFFKDKFSSIRPVTRVEKIPVKLAAGWIIKNHYLGSFAVGDRRLTEFSGTEHYRVSLSSARRSTKTGIPNVFGPAHARDCLLLQRFALEDALEFNAESYFLARVRALLKREGYCGILTLEATRAPESDALGNIAFPGQIGTIFKSDNAVYLGRTGKSDEYLFADGVVLSNCSFSELVNNRGLGLDLTRAKVRGLRRERVSGDGDRMLGRCTRELAYRGTLLIGASISGNTAKTMDR